MHISCTQENLKRALSAASRAVAVRATLPVLGTILFQTQKGRLRIAATDLEIGVEFLIGAKIDSEGQLALPARLTNDVVAALQGESVVMTGKDNEALFEAGGLATKVRGLDPNEFPLIPEVKGGLKFNLTAAELGLVVEQVAYAVAYDQTRPILTGVLLKAEGLKATVVATDSYRLAEQKLPLKKGPSSPLQCVIPARTMIEAARIFSSGEVSITITEHQIVFQGEEARLVSRLIEGEFPNYEAILPTEHVTSVSFKAQDGARALRIATLFAKDNANTVTLLAKPPTQFGIHATAAQTGETKAAVAAQVKGQEIEASFNVRYLLDMVGIQQGEVRIALKSPTDPAILTSSSNEDLRYLVMPLKTS